MLIDGQRLRMLRILTCFRGFLRAGVVFFALWGAVRAQPGAQGPIVTAPLPLVCDYNTSGNGGCSLTEFDRTANQIHGVLVGPNYPDPLQVWAINSPASKVVFSGTLVLASVSGSYDPKLDPYDPRYNPGPDRSSVEKNIGNFCEDYDWKVALLSNESSNIITYGSADISTFCVTKDLPLGRAMKYILLVAPLYVRSAEVFHFPGGKDPLRKAPSAVAAPATYCGVKVSDPAPGMLLRPPTPDVPASKQAGGIKPCDFYTRIGGVYTNAFGKLYNRLVQPGASQGTITYVPAIGQVPTGGLAGAKAPSTTVSYDVQLYPSGIWGKGWIGFPIVFEKANSVTANLDSMIMALSYDVPFSTFRPHLFKPWLLRQPNQNGGLARLAIRPPDIRVQYGLELGTAWPNDSNLVGAAIVRLPMVLDFHYQPSALTVFPVVGMEGGSHLDTHQIGTGVEPNAIFRRVAGFDSSLRVPFVVTHAFLGDKPATFEFSWRTRYLSYQEPFTDYVSGVREVLTKQQRSYWRGSYVLPVSTLVSFKVTVQHGGLPPDFHYLGYTLNIGLTFANPGYSEH
jgi:hypothetical protein